jgi:hypothetical protein
MTHAFQHLAIDAAGVVEQEQNQADFGNCHKHFDITLLLPKARQNKEHQHSRAGKHNRRGQDCPTEAPGDQAIEQDQSDENDDEGHSLKPPTHSLSKGI